MTLINKDSWTSIFKSLKNFCKETYKKKRVKEFQFKLIHRIVRTRKELFKFGIKTDDECLYCGNKDSIEHPFIDCPFTESMRGKVKNFFTLPLLWMHCGNVRYSVLRNLTTEPTKAFSWFKLSKSLLQPTLVVRNLIEQNIHAFDFTIPVGNAVLIASPA